jgi:hypothetical protein
VTTRRRSSRAPRTAATAAAMNEPSRDAAAGTGPRRGEVATAVVTATSQALVPRASSLGCGQARSESRPMGDHEPAVGAADEDAPWMGVNGQAGARQPPSAR